MRIPAILAIGTGFDATVAAALPDVDTLEAIGKWPLVAILGGVACFCVWLMYKQSRDFGRASVEAAKAYQETIQELARCHTEAVDKLDHAQSKIANKLAERPCMRDRRND